VRYLEAIEAVAKVLGKRRRGRGTDWGINGESF